MRGSDRPRAYHSDHLPNHSLHTVNLPECSYPFILEIHGHLFVGTLRTAHHQKLPQRERARVADQRHFGVKVGLYVCRCFGNQNLTTDDRRWRVCRWTGWAVVDGWTGAEDDDQPRTRWLVAFK